MTEAEKRAYIITDNKTALNAGWDDELLKIELGELAEMKFDLTLTGFDTEELNVILDFGENKEPTVKEDEFDETPPDEPTTQLGDIYQLGRHRLMCGDSTDAEAVAKLMGGAKADLYLTDPPYNVDYEGKTKDALKIQNDKMDDDSFRQFLRDAFAAADTVMKCGAVFYIWHADSEGYNFRGACHDIGWQVRQCLIWNKNSLVMGHQDYHWKHEPCLYGWKDGAGHLWASDRKQTTVLNFDKPTSSKEHPTMKPVLLFDYQIKNNTKAEDIVLDSFGGSGTTLIACEQNGRTAYLMELDPKYCDVIVARWEKLTGEKAVKLNADND
jgi:site-specific DNA-methyltransferase (adenine-specific)